MLNTITLSTDLRTLYLIDDGRLIAYNLEKAQGVVIGTLDGQLAVVSGRRRLPDIQGSRGLLTTSSEQPQSMETVSGTTIKQPDPGTSQPDPRSFKFRVQDNNQFTAAFNPDTGTLGVMGATDIIAVRVTPEGDILPPDGNCELVLFDLSRTQVFLRRLDDLLVVEERLIEGS